METLTEQQRTQLETVHGRNNKLIWAIFKGTPESVEYFINQGADIEHRDKDGRTPIYLAGRDGRFEALDILIRYGGNIEFDGDRGSTSLYVAAQNGHPKCVEVLIKHGANLECKFTGFYTPVYIAAQKGFDEIVELLIKAGANIEAPCPHGSTALFVAAQNGHSKATRVLLENGANTEVCFNSKTTPLEQAASRNRKDCVQLLLQYGAHFEKAKEIKEEEDTSTSQLSKLFQKFRLKFKRPDKRYVLSCKKVVDQFKAPIKCMTAHDNIIYLSFDDVVTKWDVNTNECLHTFKGHSDHITCLYVNEDVLYSGSADRQTICWDVYTGEKLQILQGHTSAITAILYHSYTEKDKQNFVVSKKIVYTGSADKTVKGYDPADGARKVKFEGHKGPISALYAKNYKIYQMSYDVLYSASLDGTVRSYDIETGAFLMEFGGAQGPITCIAEYEDVLFTGSLDNSICSRDRLRGKLLNKYEHHSGGVTCLKVFKGVVFSGSLDNTIKTWDGKTMNVLETVEGHSGAITNICMGSDMIYTASTDKTVRCWVLQKEAAPNKEENKNHNSISLEDRQFITNSSHKMEIWDMKGSLLHKVPTKSAVTAMLLHKGTLYAGFADATVKSWTTDKVEFSREYVGHKERVNCIVVNEKRLFTGSNDRTVKVFSLENGEMLGSFEADGPILSIAVENDMLFAGLSDKMLNWSLKNIRKIN